MRKIHLGYKSFRAEPGILIEVFLPKRNRFQDILYETLKDGFSRRKVMKHFKDKDIQKKINKYLEWLEDKNQKAINTDMLKYFETVLWGYSIYEVDGVFLGDNNSFCYGCAGIDLRKDQSAKNDVECEERTQVIKIIFMPDYGKIASILREKYRLFRKTEVIKIARKLFLCYPENNIRLHEKQFKNDKEKVKYFFPDIDAYKDGTKKRKLVEKLICYLLKWIGFTGIFLFGFLIFQICERILNEEKKNKYKPEDELWVTSHWDFLVNKVLHKKLYKKNKGQNERNNNPNSAKYLGYLLRQK